jgi:hypothetical protein
MLLIYNKYYLYVIVVYNIGIARQVRVDFNKMDNISKDS